MKRVGKILLGVLIVGLVIGTFAFLWNKTRPPKTIYEIASPAFETLEKRAVATGKVTPRDEVLIKPQISGIISEVFREAGEMVKAGDIIARVRVIPDMGQLNSAESRATLSIINRDQAMRDYQRIQELFKSKVVSNEEFEKSKVAYETAVEEVRNAKDNLEIVRDGVAKSRANLSNTQIRATVSGMILDVPIKVGHSVIMTNQFNEGTTIAEIADMNDMIFIGKVDETEVGRLKEDMELELTIGALQDVKLQATLEYVSPKGVEENGVVQFEIKAAATIPAELFIRAGYSANAIIVIEKKENVLAVPENTIVYEGGVPVVYILTSAEGSSEQEFEKSEVVLGMSNGISVEVLEGVSEGDKLRGMLRPVEKAKKEPKEKKKSNKKDKKKKEEATSEENKEEGEDEETEIVPDETTDSNMETEPSEE